MNNLTDLYNEIKSFAEGHLMVNEFIFAASEEELQQYDFNYRSLILIPSSSNLSRDLNSPIYTLSFSVVVLDRTIKDNSLASIQSIEENIFVIGQLQDKLLQIGRDVSFEEIELLNTPLEDYNITTAFSDFDIALARSPYIKSIDE
jgi:hypothetical protein